MNKYAAVSIWCLVATYTLLNGLYAIRRPADWLKSKWMRTREFRGEDASPEQLAKARASGVLTAIVGIFLLGIITYVLAPAIAGAWHRL
jgi:hypothetical protein